MLFLLLLYNFVVATTKLHIRNNKNRKINLHTFSVQLSITQLRRQIRDRHTSVRLTPIEASSGQEQYCVRSAWHVQSDLRSAWHVQSDITRSDVPPGEAFSGQEQYYVRSAWHLQSDIRLAWHVQSDIPRSDVPPATGIWWPKAVLHQVSLTFAVRHTQVRCTPN